MSRVAASEFKAKCLAIIDEVAATGEEVTITKHGKPMVKVVPYVEDAEPFIGRLAGTVTIRGDIIEPIDAGWEALEEAYGDRRSDDS
jgi:prevent-host-death family protein